MNTIEVPLVSNSNIKKNIAVPKSFKIQRGKYKPADGSWMRCFRFLTAEDGDKRVVWDCRDIGQIEEAKIMFDECVAKGLVPYRVGTDGKATPEVMDEFDPNSEEVIFLPIGQVTGG